MRHFQPTSGFTHLKLCSACNQEKNRLSGFERHHKICRECHSEQDCDVCRGPKPAHESQVHWLPASKLKPWRRASLERGKVAA